MERVETTIAIERMKGEGSPDVIPVVECPPQTREASATTLFFPEEDLGEVRVTVVYQVDSASLVRQLTDEDDLIRAGSDGAPAWTLRDK